MRTSRITLALLLAVAAVPACLWGQTRPTITFNKRFAPPKSKVLISGKNFAPNVGVLIQLDQRSIGQAHTDASGAFLRAPITIPSGTTEGKHLFAATDSTGISLGVSFLIETDWTHQRFDPSNSANNLYEWKLDKTTVKALAPVWSTAGRPGPFNHTTAVVAGRVVYFCNATTGLQALNPATGSLLWWFNQKLGPRCETTPTSNGAGHSVFWAQGNSTTPTLLAVSTITHAKIWSRALSPSNDSFYSWMIAAGDSLFVLDDQGSIIESWKQSNGALNWEKSGPFSQMAWNGGNLFVPTGAGLNAYNAATGASLWTDIVLNGCASAAVSVGSTVYTQCNNSNAYAFGTATGLGLWSDTTGWQDNFALANGNLYGGAGPGFAQAFIAEKATNGALNWLDAVTDTFVSDPIVANGIVYLGVQQTSPTGGCSNYVFATDGSNGNLLWSNPFSAPCTYGDGKLPLPSAVVDGTLYVNEQENGELWAFR